MPKKKMTISNSHARTARRLGYLHRAAAGFVIARDEPHGDETWSRKMLHYVSSSGLSLDSGA